MEKFIVLFLCYFTYVCSQDIGCDYSFGDPSWNASTLFFDKVGVFHAGDHETTLEIPVVDNQVISFVCVNVPPVYRHFIKVSFSAMDARVTVATSEIPPGDFNFRVRAMRHAYG